MSEDAVSLSRVWWINGTLHVLHVNIIWKNYKSRFWLAQFVPKFFFRDEVILRCNSCSVSLFYVFVLLSLSLLCVCAAWVWVWWWWGGDLCTCRSVQTQLEDNTGEIEKSVVNPSWKRHARYIHKRFPPLSVPLLPVDTQGCGLHGRFGSWGAQQVAFLTKARPCPCPISTPYNPATPAGTSELWWVMNRWNEYGENSQQPVRVNQGP